MSPTSNDTRRNFLKSSAVAGLAVPALLGAQATSAQAEESAEPAKRADDSTRDATKGVAFIGTGIRYHSSLARSATQHRACRAICDADAVQAGRALQVAMDSHRHHGYPIDIDVYEDYRQALKRDDVDVVVIASPDHWHTKQVIDSLRAGKDVYCEKPLTLTIREGQQILQVLNQTGRVMQVGTQQRSEFGRRFATAAALVRDGRIGGVRRVTVGLDGSRTCDPLPVVEPPKQLNWDLWQGQAPTEEYRQGPLVDDQGWGAGHSLGRTHRYYRWWYEYSGGKLTDWGAHHVDIAMWSLDKLQGPIGEVTIDPQSAEHPVPFVDGMPTIKNQFNAAVKFRVLCTFADGVEMMVTDNASDLGFGNGIMFQGSQGKFFVNRGKLVGKPVEDLKQKPLPEDALHKLYGHEPPKSHMKNFFDCVDSREQPVSDVASHHRMLSICHAINIAMRLGRKLTYDTAAEQFVGDEQANTFIERPQRAGYAIDA